MSSIFLDKVLNILKDIGKASGPDRIHNRILHEGAHQLAKPLCDLFNVSLTLCILPSSWKISNVYPIFKSGDPSIPSNYRPVSLLNPSNNIFLLHPATANVVWDNCPCLLKDQLDKIQMEAARIVTGCSKLVSLLDLTREAGWESLSERRHKHKLLLYFKMVNGLCPSTLSALVPQRIGSTSSYNLRGSQNHRIPTCRTELYKRSFLPTVIEKWNNYPLK